MSTLIGRMLDAKLALGGTGNRRRLFTRFDDLFSQFSHDSHFLQGLPSIALAPSGGGFQFRRIVLQNWKAFEFADISFPTFKPALPIVLIGGDNGNGKTSILEAIMAGIYGQRAHLDLDRWLRDGTETSGLSRRLAYRQAIERSMHRTGFDTGSRMASVTLLCDTREGLLELERRWYFDDTGRFLEEDEEVVLRVGDDRIILAAQDNQDAAEFYQDTIDRLLAPPSMLPFFLFDGEQVSRLAERELGDQVRFGIESALGITTLRALVDDLRDYARDRGRDIQADDAEAEASANVAVMEQERSDALDELTHIESQLSPLRARRDEIVRGMGSLGAETFNDGREILELRHSDESQLRKLRDELMTASARFLPILLCGNALLEATDQALSGRIAPEASKSHEALQALLSAFSDTSPKFDRRTESTLVKRLTQAWKAVNGTTGSGTGHGQHGYLEGHRVDRIQHILRHTRTKGIDSLNSLLMETNALKADMARRAAAATASETASTMRDALSSELEAINKDIAELEGSRRKADHKIGRIETKLEPARTDRERRRQQRRTAVPLSAAVDAANLTSEAIIRAIDVAVPTYYAVLAEGVTKAYRKLAHKGIVKQIRIGPDGSVSLLDFKGRDLNDTDASAGENQVFAMALIATVSDLLAAPLPLVIDTPLGRLDPGHRERILDYFAGRRVQTILLSQPEEVGGRYYDRIESKVAAEYHLTYAADGGGLGGSTLEPGYFPRRAA